VTAVNTVNAPDLPPLLENRAGPTRLATRLVNIWNYRELLGNLVRRELKVKYKNSMFGFLWTLMNPLLYLAVFSVVFTLFLRSGAPRYGLLLLSGLLAFNLFSNGVTAATTSITGNGALVQKVWFPREILPIAAIGGELVTFFFQIIILFFGLAIFGQSPEWTMLWLLIPTLAVTLLMALGAGLLLSGLNVHYRDVQHFLDLALLTWFWMTPVVYLFNLVGQPFIDRWGVGAERWAMLNPMTPIVVIFQRVIYNPTNFSPEKQQETFSLMLQPTSWYLENLAISAAFGFFLLFTGLKVFGQLERNLGEVL